jgi:hypothetical protein
VLVSLIGCADEAGDAIHRGDRLFGEGRLDAAIAEYKFALRQDEGWMRPSPNTSSRFARMTMSVPC